MHRSTQALGDMHIAPSRRQLLAAPLLPRPLIGQADQVWQSRLQAIAEGQASHHQGTQVGQAKAHCQRTQVDRAKAHFLQTGLA